ncbi:MAG: T9SS type A sorting domain-containing protein [Bacteroidales bacterium]|nr:T9SS type A sorting domain-containing protein [Bacteroidales bacterium]
MKSLIIILMALFVISLNAQQNYPEHFESYKIGKYKPANSQKNPLLDKYDLKFVHLDLEVSNTSTYVQGNALLRCKPVNNPLDIFAAELIDEMTVDSVLIDGVSLSFTHSGDIISVIVSPDIPVGQNFDAKIYYKGDPGSSGGFFSGITSELHNWSGIWTTWTLSESFHAKEWWPTKQDLTDKADSSWFFITCNDDLMAGSNGLLTNTVSLPDNKVRYEWKSSYPIVYYLLSFAVSDYLDYSIYAHPEGADSVLVQNYLYNNPAYLAYYQAELDRTAELIELYSEKFGLYPFSNEKYGHCTAPLGGGMEHQTMTTMGYYEFWIIAHELGHMWFGDDVTCATWQDIWINEGFASYSEYIALENLNSYEEAQDWMVEAHGYALGQPEGSVFIPLIDAENESRIFSYALSYKKGASLLHMIRFEIDNDSIFYQSLKNYRDVFSDSVATGDDFMESIELSTGMDFTQFFEQWYYGKGYPSFDVVWYQIGDSLFFNSLQSTSSDETSLFVTPMEYLISFSDNPDTTIRVMHNELSENYSIKVGGTVSGMEIDPNNWILDGEGSVIIGIPENDGFEAFFSVSPNPASNNLKICFSSAKEKTLEISNVYGSIVFSEKLIGETKNFDVSNFESGLYFIKIKIDNKQFVEKILIF